MANMLLNNNGRSLGAKKITNSSHLEVYLYNGGSESNIWSIDVSADLSITNHTGIPPVVMVLFTFITPNHLPNYSIQTVQFPDWPQP